jgi:hypothetical protein
MNTELTARERVTELTNAVMSREVTQAEMFAKILQCLGQTIKELEELRAKYYHLDVRAADNIKTKALAALRSQEREKDESPQRGPIPGHTYSQSQKAKIYRAKYGREAPEDRIKAQEKECGRCGVMKPFHDYHVNSRNADGKDTQCKVCKIAYKKRVAAQR